MTVIKANVIDARKPSTTRLVIKTQYDLDKQGLEIKIPGCRNHRYWKQNTWYHKFYYYYYYYLYKISSDLKMREAAKSLSSKSQINNLPDVADKN